jgi:hypothetical protein
MSFTEVMAELPALTVSEWQLLTRRTPDLDGPPLSNPDESRVEQRTEELRKNPAAAFPLNEMKARRRSRFVK